MQSHLLSIIYLIGSVSFIMGMKMMGNAKTARKGNLVGAAGMTLAIVGTIVLHEGAVSPIIYGLILLAILIGTIVGWMTAKKVQMTKMPELVSIFNGMGGACAALISHIMEVVEHIIPSDGIAPGTFFCILAGLVIGSISFSGSIIAFLKLNGTLDKPVRLPKYNIINTIFLIAIVAFAAYLFKVETPTLV